MKKYIFTILFQLTAAYAFSQTFQAGNKVEIYNSGAWYKGSVVQAGSDNYEGYYYVHYDQYSQNQWIKASNLRLLRSAENNISAGPRNGTYIILSYNDPTNPIRIGYFDLKSNQYTYYNLSKKQIGQGTYSYDIKSKMISWKTGPFKEANLNGAFETDREGKTHKVRLNTVTIGSNSTDSN
jgi:hypothetical protein